MIGTDSLTTSDWMGGGMERNRGLRMAEIVDETGLVVETAIEKANEASRRRTLDYAAMKSVKSSTKNIAKAQGTIHGNNEERESISVISKFWTTRSIRMYRKI